jgi:hypothetical protein
MQLFRLTSIAKQAAKRSQGAIASFGWSASEGCETPRIDTHALPNRGISGSFGSASIPDGDG